MQTYIKSRQLIVDPSLPPMPQGIVRVEDEIIRAVGTPESLPIPPGAQVIDHSAETVMPGLIDSHTHITVNNKFKIPLSEHATIDLTTAVLRGAGNLPR